MRLAKFNDENGSAVLEFVGFGLLFQISILIAALQVAEVQKLQIASESIARHSLRSFILGQVSVESTAQQVAQDFGITQTPVLQLSCNPDCESSGSIANLRVILGKAVAQSTMRIE